MKYLHIMLGNGANTFRFINALYNNLSRPDYFQHSFLITSTLNYVIKTCPSLLIYNYDNLLFYPQNKKAKTAFKSFLTLLKEKMEEADVIIWHSLIPMNSVKIIKLALLHVHKSAWVTDFTDRTIPNVKSKKHKQRKFAQKKLDFMKSIRYVNFSIPWGRKNFRRDYGKNKLISEIPYPFPKSRIEIMNKYVQRENKGLNCLVGYDGRKSNMHMGLISYLKHLSEEDIKIFLPMNFSLLGEWGVTEHYSYRDRVKALSENVFGKGNVIKLRRRDISENEFFNTISKCDIAVFNDNRPIGITLVFYMLYLGKKVFMNKVNILSGKLSELYLPVYSLTELGTMSAEQLKGSAVYENTADNSGFTNENEVVELIEDEEYENDMNREYSPYSDRENDNDYYDEKTEEQDGEQLYFAENESVDEENTEGEPKKTAWDKYLRGREWLEEYMSESKATERWVKWLNSIAEGEDYEDMFDMNYLNQGGNS